jgi:transposase
MGPPSRWTADQKLQMVLSVLRGEDSMVGLARRHGVSDATLAKWRDTFLAGGAEALAAGSRPRRSSRETELEAETEELKAALGEAHAELRVWRKKGAIYPATRTSS